MRIQTTSDCVQLIHGNKVVQFELELYKIEILVCVS